MANEKKKINELVSDEDPTAELDVVTFRQDFNNSGGASSAEADVCTSDFNLLDDGTATGVSIEELNSDLRRRSETIERLQYDIAQLHSKWLGLETEITVREELTANLNAELKSSARKLERKEKLLQKRDRSLKLLKAEIRERDQKFRELQESVEQIKRAKRDLESGDEINKARKQLTEQAGQLASRDGVAHELRVQQERTEKYADQLRRHLSDLSSSSERTLAERNSLEVSLAGAEKKIEELSDALDRANTSVDEMATVRKDAEAAHAEEIRLLRFEIGEAEDTLAQNEYINEQLASDLVDTRGFRVELERMLYEVEGKSRATIKGLEKKVSKLEKKVRNYEKKLEAKNDAINCLLGELAKRSSEKDSIGEMEDVIQEIDDRMSEQIDDRPPGRERVTRLLIGRIDDQELRFPLFKDRLTIGRTQQNDIQLKAQYISRRHAVITTEGESARVIDWGSKNGVYVNSKRVTEHFLNHGDIVTIGIAEFRYEELKKRDN